ncbi:hypothetical protein DVS77_34570, partial [Mycolicibacterium moriokaense]
PEAGSVQARDCVQVVEVVCDEALRAARSALDPAAGRMVSAVWAPGAGRLALMIHHLAVDGVSWRILVEDFNIGWAQLRAGEPIVLPASGTSFARWSSLLAEHARSSAVLDSVGAWRQVASTPAAVPAIDPAVDTYANAGQLTMGLDPETTRLLLGEVPAAFHAGVQDILLIAFGLAVTELLGAGDSPIGIDVEGHGRAEELGADIDLSRTVG